MSLLGIRATFICDGCGTPFSVGIDPASGFAPGWSAIDLAEDAVRGSLGYLGPPSRRGLGGLSSVQGGKCLCGPCTDDADAKEAEVAR